MMTQGVLPFQYQIAKKSSGWTSFAGLGPYLDLIYAAELPLSIRQNVTARSGKQGWTDAQMIIALILLNLAGGDHVSDLNRLDTDQGLRKLLSHIEQKTSPYLSRRQKKQRWRKPKTRSFPSASAVFNYLSFFHNLLSEKYRKEKKAYIPSLNAALSGLMQVNRDFLAYAQRQAPQSVATLDQDATLIKTQIRTAYFCYQHYPAYQPLNTYWFEKDLLVHSEFRDGNVPAGFQEKRVLETALEQLPAGVTKVFLRTDTAGYQKDLLRYCAKGINPRFGIIEFAISADVTSSFKEAVLALRESDWCPIIEYDEKGHDIITHQEWAEVCFVPEWISHSVKNPHYRYLAIREPLHQVSQPLDLLPFPTMTLPEGKAFKVFGLVSNRQIPGNELILWHRQRCGKSEEVHAIQKDDLAGGYMPSHLFGANAGWWAIMILAYNLSSFMKHKILGGEWENKRLKTLRYFLIGLSGKVICHGRQLVIRLPSDVGDLSIGHLLIEMRGKILMQGRGPPQLLPH